MNQHLLDALMYLLAAVLVAIAPFVVAIAVQGARYVTSKLHITLTVEQEHELERGLLAGIAQAAAKLRGKEGAGDEKKAVAIRIAKSIAPKAFGSLPAEQQEALVEATYVKLRPSLPSTLSTAPTNPPPASSSSSGGWLPVTDSQLPRELLRGEAKLPAPSITPKESP